MLVEVSTRGTALTYPCAMRSTLLPTFALSLTLGLACGDSDAPANEPGEFGEPCVNGEDNDTPDGCVKGLYCYLGYCEETCVMDSDCPPIEGFEHVCQAQLCRILCNDKGACPQDFPTPLVCELGPGSGCLPKEA